MEEGEDPPYQNRQSYRSDDSTANVFSLVDYCCIYVRELLYVVIFTHKVKYYSQSEMHNECRVKMVDYTKINYHVTHALVVLMDSY